MQRYINSQYCEALVDDYSTKPQTLHPSEYFTHWETLWNFIQELLWFVEPWANSILTNVVVDNFNVLKILRKALRLNCEFKIWLQNDVCEMLWELNCEFEIWLQNDVWEMLWDWVVKLRCDNEVIFEICFKEHCTELSFHDMLKRM